MDRVRSNNNTYIHTMYVCICMYMYVCMYLCMWLHTCMAGCMHACMYVYFLFSFPNALSTAVLMRSTSLLSGSRTVVAWLGLGQMIVMQAEGSRAPFETHLAPMWQPRRKVMSVYLASSATRALIIILSSGGRKKRGREFS